MIFFAGDEILGRKFKTDENLGRRKLMVIYKTYLKGK